MIRMSLVGVILYSLTAVLSNPAWAHEGECHNAYSYNEDTKPIIDKRCATCHSSTPAPGYYSVFPYLTNYSEVYAKKDNIKNRVSSGSMPPSNLTGMTDQERQLVIAWIDEGADEEECVNEVYTLNVTKSPSGGGTVTSTSPASPAINCGSTCSQNYPLNTQVTLKAVAAAGYVFKDFTGCDAPSGDSCVQTIDKSSETVTANFTANNPVYTLTVAKSPSGGGTVTSTSPASPAINCGSTCSQNYPLNTKVTLKAVAAQGYKFNSFTGCDAPSGDSCVQTIDKSSELVTANFTSTAPSYTLIVNSWPVAAAGTITSSSPTAPVINCGSTCTQSYPPKTKVTLKAAAAAGYKFVKFSGCDAPSGSSCVQTLDKTSELVTANFVSTGTGYNLTVSVLPSSAAGSIKSNGVSPALDCGSSCSQYYAKGTTVKLSARPETGYMFTNWTGCDSYSGMECVQKLDQNPEKVTANFVPATGLPRIDHIVSLPPATIVPDERGDFMFSKSIGLGLKAGKTYYIAGSQIVAKDSKGNVHPGLHHLLVLKAPKKGSTSQTGSQGSTGLSSALSAAYKFGNLYGGYVPGNGLFIYPMGVAGQIQGDDTLFFNVHVNILHAPPDVDKTIYISWNLMLVESATEIIHNVLAVNPSWMLQPESMLIPAYDPYVVKSYAIDPFEWADSTSDKLTLFSTLYHMHQWGIEGWLEKISKNGQSTFLHKANDFNFAYQKNYYLDTPLEFVRGGGVKAKFTCVWDNSSANQPEMDGGVKTPEDLVWGESSYDEMCMNVLSFTEKLIQKKSVK